MSHDLRDTFALHAPPIPEEFFPEGLEDTPAADASEGRWIRWGQKKDYLQLIQWPYVWADSQLKERERINDR